MVTCCLRHFISLCLQFHSISLPFSEVIHWVYWIEWHRSFPFTRDSFNQLHFVNWWIEWLLAHTVSSIALNSSAFAVSFIRHLIRFRLPPFTQSLYCHSIIQFHFNLRIELKWIDFVGPFIPPSLSFNFTLHSISTRWMGVKWRKRVAPLLRRSIQLSFTECNEIELRLQPPHRSFNFVAFHLTFHALS